MSGEIQWGDLFEIVVFMVICVGMFCVGGIFFKENMGEFKGTLVALTILLGAAGFGVGLMYLIGAVIAFSLENTVLK